MWVDRMLDRLAAIPIWVAGLMFTVGGVLATAHLLIVQASPELTEPEWPQWVGRLTVMWYWALLPFATMIIWSRRRRVQGRLGYVGAVLAGIGVVQYLILAVGTTLWGAVFGRGELPEWMMWSDLLLLVGLLGVAVLAVSFLRDRGIPWIWPALLLLAMAVRVLLPNPYAIGAVLLLLSGLLITQRPRPRSGAALDDRSTHAAH